MYCVGIFLKFWDCEGKSNYIHVNTTCETNIKMKTNTTEGWNGQNYDDDFGGGSGGESGTVMWRR